MLGAKKEVPEETLPVDTVPASEATESAAPEVEYATAQIDGIPAVLETLDRGDSLDVVQAYDEKHFVVKLDSGFGLVEKNLIRVDTTPAYEAWTGYAYQDAALYDNYRLAGEPVRKLKINEQVQVLYELETCYFVEVDGKTGYMKKTAVEPVKPDLVEETKPTEPEVTEPTTPTEQKPIWTPPVL